MSRHKNQRGFVNNLDYIHSWMLAADMFTAGSPVVPPPPDHLVRAFGRPACASCWDTGLCPECYGQFPQYCEAQCGDGTCSCAAGAARRAAYAAAGKREVV